MSLIYEKIGEVCVDSGQVRIVDPAYITGEPPMPEEILDKLAPIVGTKFGDGGYPVFKVYDGTPDHEHYVGVFVDFARFVKTWRGAE